MADRIMVRFWNGDDHFSRPYLPEVLALMGNGDILVLKDTPFPNGMYIIGRRIIHMAATAHRIDDIEIVLEWHRGL